MNTLVSRESPSHWYYPDGKPCHEVERADGQGMRSTNITDARKLGLYPSITNILGCIAKPALQSWLIEQGIMASLTLPRSCDEGLDTYAKRIVKDMDAQSRKAAEFGSQIHEACAAFVEAWGESATSDQEMHSIQTLDHAVPFCKWVTENITRVHAVEEVLVGDGYAGRVDLIADINGARSIIDLKTQAVRNGKAAFYPEFPLQLSAYRKAYDPHGVWNMPLVSIVINSKEPSPVHVHTWPDEDYYDAFRAAFIVWKYVKGWD